MITKNIKQFCKDYTQIENYEAAINDKNETWHCHHRLEIRDDYINTREELKMMNLYYNRPPEELIFLKNREHIKLHQTDEKKKKLIRKKLIEYHHGTDWTEEDQEKFERERNRRQCLNHRNKYREDYTAYQLEYQRKYREKNKYHYGFVQWNKLHPDDPMTIEQYIAYRQNKERMKEIKEQNDD